MFATVALIQRSSSVSAPVSTHEITDPTGWAYPMVFLLKDGAKLQLLRQTDKCLRTHYSIY